MNYELCRTFERDINFKVNYVIKTYLKWPAGIDTSKLSAKSSDLPSLKIEIVETDVHKIKNCSRWFK